MMQGQITMADMTPLRLVVIVIIMLVISMDPFPVGRRLGSKSRQLFYLFLSWPPLRDRRTCSAKIEQSMPEVAVLPPGKMVTQADELVPFVPHPIDNGDDEKSESTDGTIVPSTPV
jgi:hypothetical protein